MIPASACVLFLLAAGPSGESPQLGPRHRDGRGVFSVQVPAGWVTIEDVVFAKLGGMALRRESQPPAATLKAVAVDFPLPMSLDQYIENSTQAYQKIWKIEERSPVSLAGARAVRLVIVQTLGADTKRLLKYFVATPKGAIVLTVSVSPEAFAGRLPEFEAIAGSLKLER